MNKEKEIKEDFCPACIVVPLAMIGGVGGVASSTAKDEYKTYKKIVFWISIIITIISFIIGIYVLKGDCKKCKIK
jgi:hypothetical protein